MTQACIPIGAGYYILIHTSVKLVTSSEFPDITENTILIHTSVKLVTPLQARQSVSTSYFNPHEREARDETAAATAEAANTILIHTSVKLVTDYQHEPIFYT